jgi:hypothetical protein
MSRFAYFAGVPGGYAAAAPVTPPVVSGVVVPGNTLSVTPGVWDRPTDRVYSLYVNGGSHPHLSRVTEAEIEAYALPLIAVSVIVREHALLGGGHSDSNTLFFRPEQLSGVFAAYEIDRSPYTLSGSDYTGTIGDLSGLNNHQTVVGAPVRDATSLNGRSCIRFRGTPDRSVCASTNNGTGGTLTAATYLMSIEMLTTTSAPAFMNHGNTNNRLEQRVTPAVRGVLGAVALDCASPAGPFFVAFTWDGATIRSYMNGSQIASVGSAGAGAANSSGLHWASNVSAAAHANFKSAGFWCFNVMLTSAQITHFTTYVRTQGMIP